MEPYKDEDGYIHSCCAEWPDSWHHHTQDALDFCVSSAPNATYYCNKHHADHILGGSPKVVSDIDGDW